MKQLLPADSLANRISFYHLLALLASLPFNLLYSHLILISFAMHTLIQLTKQRLKSAFRKRALLLQSIFFITAISSIYTINKSEALNEIVLQLPILLIPIIFPLSGFDFKKYRRPLLMGFSAICTLTVLYLFWDAFRTMRFYKLPFTELFSTAFTNHNFSEPINMHATFFSMQLVIALVYLLTVIAGRNTTKLKILCGICSAVLIAGLFQLCSKSALFPLFISICVAFPFFMFSGKQRFKYAIALWTLALLAGISVFKVKAFKERYFNELKADLSKPVAGESVEPRRARWNVAVELIKASPIIGHGAGSEPGLLHEAFYQKKYYSSFINHLNAHNQYLSFLMQSGIIGLVIYLLTLVYGFRYSLESKDLLFFTFMVLLAVVSLSEDYLAVDKGVFFYAVFFSFFTLSNPENNNKLTVKQQDKFILASNLVDI